MKKAITLLFLLLLIVLFTGVVMFFRGAPHLTPEPLKPVLSWVDEAQIVVTSQFSQWRRQLTGDPTPVVASDAARSPEPLAAVTLGRNEVSTVTVDQDGQVAIQPPATEAVSESQVRGNANLGANTSADMSASTSSNLNPGLVNPGDAGEQSSAELDAIARADAAIAAADAALARAQGLPVPANATVPRPIDVGVGMVGSAVAAPAKRAETSASELQVGATQAVKSDATTAVGGSALGGASIVLSQASLAVTPTEPIVLAAIPAPTIIPPDAPAPIPAASQAGREQQAIIENFLAGEIVEFETGRDVLTSKGRQALQSLVGIIERNENSIITIQGHTDSVGDERSNLELSTSRAIAARSYLIRRGVAADRLLVQGFGERRPISTNKTSAGRERNRRIDFAVSDG